MDPARLGRGIRALRQRRSWRQCDLADAAGVSRSSVSRVEQGHGDNLPLAMLARIPAPLDARVVVRLVWHAEELDRLIDAVHASVVELAVRELQDAGWLCVTEATFNVYGERGSIDVLAFHPETRVLLVIEVKSSIPEIGGMLLTLDRTVRLAPQIARERGWEPVSVARLLVVRDGRTTRRRLAEHEAMFRTAFPVRGWDVRRWLQRPTATRGWSGLWLPTRRGSGAVGGHATDAHTTVSRHRFRRPPANDHVAVTVTAW